MRAPLIAKKCWDQAQKAGRHVQRAGKARARARNEAQMSVPDNVQRDDAAFFQLSSVDTDENDTEDPIGRGQSAAGKRDMFVTRLPKRPRGGPISAKGVPGMSFRRTPGAKLIP